VIFQSIKVANYTTFYSSTQGLGTATASAIGEKNDPKIRLSSS